MALSPELQRLVDVSAPLWAGEAEVVRTYFTSPIRTLETDLLWIQRQCSKEFNGTGAGEYKNMGVFLGPLTELQLIYPKIDTGEEDSVDRHYVLELLEILKEEYEHFCLFSDVFDKIKPANTPSINPHKLETWDEDAALTKVRHDAIAEHGRLGIRATRFTEGGYCTLFREGMNAAEIGGKFDAANKLIAAACKEIYEDEFDHMLEGIAGLDGEGWTSEEFQLMEDIVLKILRRRITMRNAEFSFPLTEERVQAIYEGDILPEIFDPTAAEARLIAHAAE